MNKIVSIIIPAYNCEDYILECLNSIKKQSYKNYEVIIVNDGSSDNTREICEKVAKQDNRFRVINTENNGPSHARNLGIQNSIGDHILFVDSDDYIEECLLERCMNIIIKNNSDIVFFGYNIISKSKKFINYRNDDSSYSINEVLLKMLDIEYYCYFNYLWNKLYKSSYIKENNILFNEEINIGEDACFNAEYYKYINKASFISSGLYNYIIRENNSLTQKKRNIIVIFQAYKKICDSYINLYKSHGLFSRFKGKILERYLVMLMGIFTEYEYKYKQVTKDEKLKNFKLICNDEFTIEYLEQANGSNLKLRLLKYLVLNKMYNSIFFMFKIKKSIYKLLER